MGTDRTSEEDAGMSYRLTLRWTGGFPGSPEQDTVEITEAEYDELWARFIKPKAIAEGWCKK